MNYTNEVICCDRTADLYSQIKSLLDKAESNEFALVTLDFDNFKYINDLFGYETGDLVLSAISAYFNEHVTNEELFARINADNFIFLLKAPDHNCFIERLNKLVHVRSALSQLIPPHYSLVTSCGVYFISNTAEKLSSMIDRANYARKQAKGNHSNSFNIYDTKMEIELLRRKDITLNMKQALKEKEFEMYLQPKVMLKTNELIGAEALVRWNSKQNGIIYPDEFIPVLEQNGFITLIDYFMLEQACIFLNSCKKRNITPLPISVNFSRIHINKVEFVANVKALVQKHKINPALIEIELTESIFIKELPLLIDIVNQLKAIGFKVSIDDFGTAYSSINYLKDVPVDIIKIDKSFLNSSSRSEKGRLVIAKIIEMIKSLRLLTVVEGVEELEQVEFLQKLSCDIVQGYYYARPMKVEAYVDFVKSYGTNVRDIMSDFCLNEKLKTLAEKDASYQLPKEFEMDNWELYTMGQNIDMGLMKGILDEYASVQYVNKTALDYVGYTAKEFREIFDNRFSAFTHPDDVATLTRTLSALKDSNQNVSFRTRAIRKDGKVITLQGRASCVVDSYGRNIGIYAFQDVTKEIEERQLWESSLKSKICELETLYSNLPGGVLYFEDDEELTITFINEGFSQLVGYSSQDIKEIFDSKLLRLIGKNEGSKFINKIKKSIKENIELCLVTKNGETVWVVAQGQLVTNEGHKQYCVVLVNITEQIIGRQALRLSEQRYKLVMEQSDDIVFDWDFATDTVIFSEKFESVFGIDPNLPHASTNNIFFSRLHKEDTIVFRNWVALTLSGSTCDTVDARLKTINNTYTWFRTKSTTIFGDNGVPLRAVGTFTNIDQQRKAMDTLRIKSQQDPLTKLFNKAESHSKIATALNKCVKNKQTAALMIMDIDNFKGVNDNLGHQFGDAVLVDIANKIKDIFKRNEILGRFGGDEFVAFLPDTTLEQATENAEQLVLALRNNYFGDEKKYKISISIGIALTPTHAKTFDEIYRFADVALYDSKRKGKDCYTIYNNTLLNDISTVSYDAKAIKQTINSHYEDDPIFNIFEMLYETKDLKITLNKILEIIGSHFDVDRAYIFETSDDGQFISNTYEWCSKGVVPEIDSLQCFPTEDLRPFFSLYNDDGIFYSNNFTQLDGLSRTTLERQGIKSVLHCGIFEEGTLRGFIGFDECKFSRIWRSDEVAMLAYISRILSTFLLKKQVSKELWSVYQNQIQMLDNMYGFIYVIDPKTHKTLYLNKAIQAFEGVKVGQKCYEIAFGADAPCLNCPVNQLSDERTCARVQIFSELIQNMVDSTASKVSWTGCPDAALVWCTPSQESKT